MEKIQLFESKKIRSHWDEENELWYFSVIDAIEVFTQSSNPRKYWSVLKIRLKNEGSQLATNCSQLKMQASDGKMRATDVATTEQLLRLIQSIPSPQVEPFKQWLAKIGYERIESMQDPEKSIDQAMQDYLKLGYTEKWINQRLKSIEVRKELTDEWKKRGLEEGKEFAFLTDIISQAWSGHTTQAYKKLKNLKKENLRDNMTNLELVLTMLAEATTAEISKEKKPKGFDESKKVAKQGGIIAGDTRKAIEKKTGKKVVTKQNARGLLEDK
ncbi:BRO family protein [Sulfurospirillum multivorans]|uniref:Prophage antirepressor-like protein n=2 Tax=Sulfurospirillum multivorans TaxID=66821 RepID=A0AA86AKL1_SULMK|nr:BRO family protein [Sulfurospirillum multivorans]AHJ12411.1 prophage antirepressor-like protein [Sulfurospirillum multivorans DSM 12446]QEH05909.1 prophage antirepressor-like protein [Sulfurospirillum multivorans]